MQCWSTPPVRVQIMPAGGSVSPETAKQILGAAGQYQAFVDARTKQLCK